MAQRPAPVASTSTFKGFGPPAWIFSLDGPGPAPSAPTDSLTHGIPLYAPPPTINSHARHGTHPSLDNEPEDEDASYGPTLKRRGNVRFVRAKLGGGDVVGDGEDEGQRKGKGKGRARDTLVEKGEDVRDLYESIVGVRAPLATPPAPAQSFRPTPDVDLTLDSDSDSDDDLLIVDPLTGHAAPPPRPRPRPRLRASALVELLLPSTASPLVPPISYGIKSNSIGWKMLAKQGWKEGEGLGPVDAEGRGLMVPLKASNKQDKKGLGVTKKSQDVSRKKAREREEIRNREGRKRELDARGGKVAARRARRDGDERKELLAYLNA